MKPTGSWSELHRSWKDDLRRKALLNSLTGGSEVTAVMCLALKNTGVPVVGVARLVGRSGHLPSGAILTQMDEQFPGIWGGRSEASNTEREMTHDPSVSKRYDAERSQTTPTQCGRSWYDGDTCAGPHHLADDVKAAQPHAYLHLPTQPLRLAVHERLERACGIETDILVAQSVHERDPTNSGQRVPFWSDEDEHVFREWKRLQLHLGVDRARDDADIGASCCDCTHNVRTFRLFEININVRLPSKELRQQCWNVFQHRDRIHQQADTASQTTGVTVKVSPHLLELLRDSPSMLQQGRAGGGQLDATAVTHQQVGSKGFLISRIRSLAAASDMFDRLAPCVMFDASATCMNNIKSVRSYRNGTVVSLRLSLRLP
jgi:hypothetical protein